MKEIKKSAREKKTSPVVTLTRVAVFFVLFCKIIAVVGNLWSILLRRNDELKNIRIKIKLAIMYFYSLPFRVL